jgi:hypothetical protein
MIYKTIMVLTLIMVLIVLNACQPQPITPTPIKDNGDIYTQAAVTFSAQLTSGAAATAITQLTRLSQPTISPTTETQLTESQQSTVPPTTTYTSPPPTLPQNTATSTPSSEPCDQAQFVGHVTVPPDSILPTGASFNKVWRVQNTGSCAWTRDYALVYIGGDRMGQITIFSLSQRTNPGETLDLSATLSVPDFDGTYQSDWMLRNPSGETFGMQADGLVPLQVKVRAITSATLPEGSIDFAAQYCTAFWRSAYGQLPCPGSSNDPRGSTILLNQPTTESGSTNQYALWTRPNTGINGWISAEYPVYTIRDQDHFMAEIGCLSDTRGCNVEFRLSFRRMNGTLMELGRWREVYDRLTAEIDLDLSSLAGTSGYFIFEIYNAGDPERADAVWLAPRLLNTDLSSNVALNWGQEGYRENSCDKLEIIFDSSKMAEARASYCKGGDQFLASGLLSTNELAQLLAWMQQLDKFNAEVFQANKVPPLISWIEFNGWGTELAHDDDIQVINGFAANLFERLTTNP